MSEIDPKRTVHVRICTTYDEYTEAPPGSIYPSNSSTWLLTCPGCGSWSALRVGEQKPAETPSWQVRGSPDRPETLSLEPSIHHSLGGGCGWHGYLRNGVFVSV